MRRMITEKDVEKLDSIKPSEIEKLGAMQDPKTAKNGFVLTANGKGQSTYLAPASSGIKMQLYFTTKSFYKEWFEHDIGGERLDRTKFPGYKVAQDLLSNYIKLGREGFPYYEKPDKTKVFIAPTDYFIMDRKYHKIIFGVKDAVYEQFVADTAGMPNPAINLDMNAYYGYEQ